jgi:hypothetical protein
LKHLATTLVAALVLGWTQRARADEPEVPLELQAELMAKVVKYDRNFVTRVGDAVTVWVVFRPGVADSERVSRQMMAALGAQATLGGVKHTDELVPFTGVDKLTGAAKEKKAAIVIFAPGFDVEAVALAKGFEGWDGLTVTTTSAGVEKGFVLGFDLVSGKPRMLLQLTQARKQNADFKAEVIRIMKVYQ